MKKIIVFFVFGFFFLSTNVSQATNAIVTRNLNLREGPSIRYALRGFIPVGHLITVYSCRNKWCQINYDSQTGWVSSRYLSFKNGNDLYHTYTIPSSSTADYY
ncbi:SH3 domain-containing protein [Bartonella sp. WD16.2]|uniref:SH3 domain-containing protein n=1 Tax=Bartonella sp. WD16.2 TaxID=1933904 RepID=UPI000999FA12|nr:SH3 domain-containing protein [Bartonella sp. WD16.2]